MMHALAGITDDSKIMKFVSYFTLCAFIWLFSVALLYGANAIIGNAKPLDRSDVLFMLGLGFFVSVLLGGAGAAGWLKKK